MRVRQVRVGDEGQLIELFCSLYQETDYLLREVDEFNLTEVEQAQLIEKHLGSRSWVLFVAEIDEKIVGFLGGTGGILKRNRHSIHIAMGVLEKHQRRGIGKQLLLSFIDWAIVNQYYRIELTVVEGNTKALSLYQSMGFIFEGRKHNALKIRGKYVDELCMARLFKA